jgi:hypothetical protein
MNERMLCKILTYSIPQEDDNAPLNVSSRAEMITGIGYHLSIDNLESASDPRFAYLFNSRAGENSRAREMRDVSDGDQSAQTIQRFRHVQRSGADRASLTAACVESGFLADC